MTYTITNVKSKIEEKSSAKVNREPHVVPLTVIRILLLYVVYWSYVNADVIQGYIDVWWEWLRHQSWYQTVYFETCLVQVYSFPFIFPYRFMYATGIASKYRLENELLKIISTLSFFIVANRIFDCFIKQF